MKGKLRPSRTHARQRGKRMENKVRTRQAILKAALALFAEKGFYHTTTKAISRKAKIAEGTLFNYFETKEDLALFFFEQELEHIVDWYQHDRRVQKAALPEKLFAIVHRLLERLAPYEEFIGAVYLRALQPSSRLSPLSLSAQEQNLRYLRFIREILAEAAANGQIPKLGDLGAYGFAVFHPGTDYPTGCRIVRRARKTPWRCSIAASNWEPRRSGKEGGIGKAQHSCAAACARQTGVVSYRQLPRLSGAKYFSG